MSEQLYVLQTLLIGAGIFVLFRNHPRLVHLQILLWTLGVIGIAWRFGLVEQLNFYSNDQRYYQEVVERMLTERTLTSNAFSIESSKLPYTGSALLLAAAGIHTALALKSISLVSFIALTSDLLRRNEGRSIRNDLSLLFFTGCGSIGMFFSTLALRETMMMLFVYRYATRTCAVTQIVSLSIIYLLRPHLAVAIAFGQILATLWRWLSRGKRIGQSWTAFLVMLTTTIGSAFYSLQSYLRSGGGDLLEGVPGISRVTRVASNFVGLQFLTVPEGTVNFSLTTLLFLRLVFSETGLIPLGFTVVCFVLAQEMTFQSQFTLCAFGIYVSIVTKTDFNSFRQNIPLMPLMGIAIIDLIRTRQLERWAPRLFQSPSRPTTSASVTGPKRQVEPTSTG